MDKILQYLKENRDRFLQELCTYLEFESISAQPRHDKDVRNCAAWIAAHCNDLGMKAEVAPTKGHPVVIAQTPRTHSSKHKPHYLVYGHYDVQPPDPLELWKHPPFKPKLENNRIYARGVSDNKGQHFAHLKAVEAYLRTGTELPCNLTFIIEGEEEVGSEHLTDFLKTNQKRLACDGAVVSDSGMPSLNSPALTYGLRGVAAMEILITGPNRDLHSGIYGGSVENPASVLCRMLANLHRKNGKVAVTGFYDDVLPLSRKERSEIKKWPYHEEAYRKSLGVPALFGESGYSPNEQRSARPTLEINGLTSGYQGEGSKTIVPSWASAKLTVRLVPDQNPKRILRAVKKQLKTLCPPTVKMKITEGHYGEAYLFPLDDPRIEAALQALKFGFGKDPILLREGGSIPIVNDFKKILGVDTLLIGLALPDDNLHSPNEKFDIRCFERGMKMSAFLWQKLG